MVHQFLEGMKQRLLFPAAALVEGDFFAVGDQPRVYEPKFTLQFLFRHCHFRQGLTNPIQARSTI